MVLTPSETQRQPFLSVCLLTGNSAGSTPCEQPIRTFEYIHPGGLVTFSLLCSYSALDASCLSHTRGLCMFQYFCAGCSLCLECFPLSPSQNHFINKALLWELVSLHFFCRQNQPLSQSTEDF